VTQRFMELLDAAVSDLEPRIQDPVAVVVRRSRMARLKTAVTCVLAVAMLSGLTVGGLVVDRRVGHGSTPLPTGSAVARPPTPHVVGDMVVAGAMELPIPAGWQVADGDNKLPCGTLTNTIMIVTDTRVQHCTHASLEVGGLWGPLFFPGSVAKVPPRGGGGPLIADAPVSITLTGGEPAWLLTGEMVLPWSKVDIWFGLDEPTLTKIINSIRTRPTGAGRLAVPGTVAAASLNASGEPGHYEPALYGRTVDPATIAEVVRVLRSQDTVVDNARACANADQQAALLMLSTPMSAPPDSLSTDPPKPSPAPQLDDQLTPIVITFGGSCQEAVSFRGGRVHLTDAAFDQLKHLFGIGTR
jgi:hypothetical protein